MSEANVLDRSLDDQAHELAQDPAKFFHESHREMQNFDPAELRRLQLRALQLRFAELKQKIPMLQKLADKQGITELHEVDDVVPLLFEHTMYKSYPPSLLEKSRFSDINKWLDKLTAADLSKVDVSGCGDRRVAGAYGARNAAAHIAFVRHVRHHVLPADRPFGISAPCQAVPPDGGAAL